MPTPESREPLPQELIDALAPLRQLLHGHERNVVFPVAGSGLSQGLDSWHGLLAALIQKVPESDRPEVEAALERQQYLEVAGFLEAEADVGREGIAAAIRARYQRPGPEKPRPEVFDLLANLPVKHFATTNFDPWLKDAVGLQLKTTPRVYTPGDPGAFADIAPSSHPLVLMLHGDADRPESRVLSAKSYRRLMHGDAAYRDGLKSLLGQRHWLFVGHSLRDPDFTSLFDAWVETFGSAGSPGAPRHFFLSAGLTKYQRLRLRNHGVQPIEYGAKGDHSKLPAVLRHLAEPPRASSEVGPKTPAPEPAPLRPRVLVAGPRFGLSDGAWERCLKVWSEGQSDPERASFQVSLELQRSDGLDRAQIAAIVRYDAIIDLSPWGAFRRWSSLGFSNAEEIGGWKASNTPVLFCTHPAPGSSKGTSLREVGPELRGHLQSLLPDGLAVCGLSDDKGERASLESILQLRPAVAVLLDERLRDIDLGRSVRVGELLDAPLEDPSLADYQRALRVVAGRVELLGDDGPRPIQEVFVDLEVTRATAPLERESAERRRERRREADGSSPSASDFGVRELEEEDRLRREEEERGQLRPETVVNARDLPRLGTRVFLEGAAGTGKTTLLKWLAASGAGTDTRPWVFVPLANLAPPGKREDLLDSCVHAALEHVRFPPECAARRELTARLRQGSGVLLLDGYDEARAEFRAVLTDDLSQLPASLNVVLSTRPTEALRDGVPFSLVALHGLSPGGPERFLGAYFGKAEPWIPKLLRELPRLPDGLRWVRTPVLLLLAAALYRRNQQLPDATLELYRIAVTGLLRWRAQRLFGGNTEQKVERALKSLADFAHECLLPREGQPRMAFSRWEVDRKREPLVLDSGLLAGSDTLRFAHLSLGEYLAARVAVDHLEEETERWLSAPVAHASAIQAREALPMAWAMAKEGKLTELLERAAARDTGDHLVLRLLLRAVAYGGAGSAALAREHGSALVELLISRLDRPSGRFGDAERRLCRDGERALSAARMHLPVGCARLFLSTPRPASEVGDEISILAVAAGGQPVRPSVAAQDPARARRLGAAWARSGTTPERIIALTAGEFWLEVRAAAVQALASDAESRPLLRERLADGDFRVRAAAFQALASDPESRPLLREYLADGHEDVRAAAVQALASDSESRPLLRECLADGHEDVRAAAVQALASDAESRPLLRERLANGESYVRAAAVQVLASDPESRPLLRERLADGNFSVRADAVQALASDPESRPLLRERLADGDSYVRAAAVQALASDPESRPLLRERLADGDSYVRAAAFQALASDPESRPLLRERLADGDSYVRAAAFQALASDPESRPLLRERLADGNFSVRVAAVQALASDPESRPLLRERLADGDLSVRAAAVQALASDPESRPLLRERLADGDFSVRAAAVRALASDPESRPLLRERLADGDFRVRAAAVQALASDPESRCLLLERLADGESYVRAAAVQALASDPESRPLLRERLADDDFRVRAAAFQALASDPESRPLLRERLADGNFSVRAAAVQALASDPESRCLLLERLADSNFSVRSAAAQALASDPESRPFLRERLADGESYVRDAAIQALASDPESRPLLRERLADGNFSVRAAAVQALASDPESRPLLRERLADSNFSVRAAAFQALASDPESRPLLRERLADGESYVRAAAVQALASDPESRPLLRERLADGESYVRAAAVQALASDPESRPLLRERLADGESYVRAAAVQALASDPESRPLLRERLADGESYERAAAVQALASDPESRPLLRERLADGDEDVRAAAFQALASDPESRPLLRERLADRNPRVRAAAVQALASDPESKPLLRERLADGESYKRDAAIQPLASDPETRPLLRERLADGDLSVCAAAVQALASDPESRPLLRERLADRNPRVRAAAVQALASDPESRPLLRERLADRNPRVRAAAVQALASDPECRPLLRERLADRNPRVRAAAVQTIASEKSRQEGRDASEEPVLRVALRVAGADPAPAARTPEALLAIEAKLSSYLHAPRRLHLDAEPELGTALVAWLLVRLGWGSTTGELGNGRLWGEVPEPIGTPFPPLLLLRVAMLDTLLPAERRLHPNHNLIEAHKVARHLRTTRPLTVFLACADVSFEDLVPPPLQPGQVRWGPTFFGFRISEGPVSVPDEAAEHFAELLLSRDPLSLWCTWDISRRHAAIDRLGVLADRGDIEPLTLAPLVSRLGPELPDPLRRSLAKRLTPSVKDAVRLVEQYTASLGTAGSDALAAPVAKPAPSPLASVLEGLGKGADGEDATPALSVLNGIAEMLRPGAAPEADALDVVVRLDRIRDRHRTQAVAKELLACVDTLVGLRPANDAFSQKVEGLRQSLRRYLHAKEGR